MCLTCWWDITIYLSLDPKANMVRDNQLELTVMVGSMQLHILFTAQIAIL